MNPLVLPSLTKHVTDYAAILSPEQVESLSRLFATHEYNTTEQVLTVLIPHREWNELLDIGLKLFNENKIGQKDLNNWLLLIVSTEEKKLRIITGKGMEIKYSEMVCREIVEKYLRPLLNEGKYEEMVKKWGEITQDKSVLFGIIKDGSSTAKRKSILFMISIALLWLSLSVWGVISEIVFWIFLIILGLWVIYLSYYLLTKYIWPEKRWSIVFAAILAMSISVFLLYSGIKTVYCSTWISANCIEWRAQFNSGWNGLHYTDNSSSSNHSSDSDSSSSYDRWGGSSNGGGYGD